MTFFQLLARFGSAAAALSALPELSVGRKHPIPDRNVIERELDDTLSHCGIVVCSDEPEYPRLLGQLAPPPPVLSLLGDPSLGHRRCVAIVGAREASAAGRKLARDIARDLSNAGIVIVSGLARGIDGEAHAAALSGGTIAVLGGGIDHVYPPQHATLYEKISQNGLLVSESPFGYRATARDFPRRNRIITGICEAILLVEAAERSGSLISARTALEQNREVLAVPGSPLDPRYAGTNRLLREGALLVRNADDVMEALSRPGDHKLRAPQEPDYENSFDPNAALPEAQVRLVESFLTLTPMPIEEIARAAKIGDHRCAAILVELELSGRATTYPGGLASQAIG
nr:DNA-processing protein DprA [Hyphomonas sp. Mor2]